MKTTVQAISTIIIALQFLSKIEITYGNAEARLIAEGPFNVADYAGEDIILRCSSNTLVGRSIVWTEFTTNPEGTHISYNEDILLSHQNAARYRIIHKTPDQYDLLILTASLQDGGTYRCESIGGSSQQEIVRAQAELIIIETRPNCTTTVGLNGIVLEGQSHTAECYVNFQGNLAPRMTWNGPRPFQVAEVALERSLWSGISFVVTGAMDGDWFQCLMNFTRCATSHPAPEDVADNPPSLSTLYNFVSLTVSWGPKNLRISPSKPYYDVDDVITCYADASPNPSYQWQNTRTLVTTLGQSFSVTEDFEGLTTEMKCEAQNVIQEAIYTGNLFTNITLLESTESPGSSSQPIISDTSTPTSLPTVSTSTPPLTTSDVTTPFTPTSSLSTVSTFTSARTTSTPTSFPTIMTSTPALTASDVTSCRDISGRWQAKDPTATLCLEVLDPVDGEIKGLLKNDTDLAYVEIVGRATPVTYDLIGWSGIWPESAFVFSYAGECHVCDGIEVLLASPLSRSIRLSPACGDSGPLQRGPTYHFYRQGVSCNGTHF